MAFGGGYAAWGSFRDAMEVEDDERAKEIAEIGESWGRPKTADQQQAPGMGESDEQQGDEEPVRGEGEDESSQDSAVVLHKIQKTGSTTKQPTAVTQQPGRALSKRPRKSPTKFDEPRTPSPTKASPATASSSKASSTQTSASRTLPRATLPDPDVFELRLLSEGSIHKPDEVLSTLDLLEDTQKFGARKWWLGLEGHPRFKAWFRAKTQNCMGCALLTKNPAKQPHGSSYACDACVKQKRPCVWSKVIGDKSVPVILPEHGKGGLPRFQYWTTFATNPCLS